MEIKLYFQKYILILNKYIEDWLKINFEDYIKIKDDKLDISDYIIYSDSEEINILINCYNVYKFYYKTNEIDEDAIKALIVYYYNLQVLDNNILLYATEKWLQIIFEGKYYFRDNLSNAYVRSDDGKDKNGYIEVINMYKRNIKYYIKKDNQERNDNPYLYKFTSGYPEKILLNNYMNCFDNFHSEKSKNIMNEIILRDTEYSSQIRRKMLGIELN